MLLFVGAGLVVGRPRKATTNRVCRVRMSEKPELTVQEKMAKALGRDVEEEKDQFKADVQRVEIEGRVEMRQKIAKAFLGVVLGVAFYLGEKYTLGNPITMLHGMEQLSPTYEVAVSNAKPTVLEFYADWCESCMKMAPKVSKLETEFAGSVNFVVMNGENPNYRELLYKYRVDGVPHFALLDADGKLQTTLIGKIPVSVLEDDLNALVKGEELPYIGFDIEDMF
ncbi:hypothetical protein NDN08_003251 [Rhodosorus marinus]|uniref:Thioredoxin domain-containing protein n=1 Tax=Rhodosorus marinus TaxID=101924 RepID=A0AAV8UYP6_9RHOD|nr:hypothetical protein NDN08_003251 [Rhodosorus marinus]